MENLPAERRRLLVKIHRETGTRRPCTPNALDARDADGAVHMSADPVDNDAESGRRGACALDDSGALYP
jgi:hypothetical protein